MTSRKSLTLVLAAALWAVPLHAAPPGFAFLEIPSGSRASALGGAGVTMVDGVEAAFWNPARLTTVKGVQLTASHFELYQKLRHEDFALGGRLFGGGVSASVRALYSEPIDERDELGNLIGTFGAHDLEFAAGYGAAFGGGLDLGVSGQVVRERIADKSAQTWAVHVGGSWDSPRWPGLRLALAALNLGPSTEYDLDGVKGESLALPAAVQGGAAYHWAVGEGFGVNGVIETRLTRGRSGIGIVGAELANASGAALRAGFRLNDDVSNFSLGAGYTLQALRLDYAYVPTRLGLEDTHRFSLTAQF